MNWQPTELKNEWVQLCPLQATDLEALYQVACDPLIWEQHPNPDRYKKEVFAVYFEGALASGGAMLISNAQGQVIGSSRFYDWDPALKEVKIGYTFFARTCWGGAYNKSAKVLMINYSLQVADRVLFHVGVHNIRSQKAMEKLGAKVIDEVTVAYYGEAPRKNFVYCVERPLP
ncbi:MAG: GNAT family N-acetyltransferase [Sphingomonadales bacterium]|nr:GNAT family N-acetyltransferase [Sphingomonadales bacterium]